MFQPYRQNLSQVASEGEECPVQELVAQPSVEAFDETFCCGLPGAREQWMRILFVHPEGNLVRTLSIRRGSGQNPADRWKAFKDLKGMGHDKNLV